MKLGVVIIPATTLLGPADLTDRVEPGNARLVVVGSEDAAKFDGVPDDYVRIAVGGRVEGWHAYEDAYDGPADFAPAGPTRYGQTETTAQICNPPGASRRVRRDGRSRAMRSRCSIRSRARRQTRARSRSRSTGARLR